jgi:glycosyltransferase involved in cell wall biosynthesis
VLPPWSHDAEIGFNAEGRAEFRRQHGLDGKFVVMYSGNHSPCHPLDTILAAAKQLAEREEIAFCFIGGGAEFGRVKRFVAEENLPNIVCLPYQPLERLSASLSAADLHLVVMGNPFVGIVHPCKAYNILRIGLPILYIGPKPSHISEALENLNGAFVWRHASHDEVEKTVNQIWELREKTRCGSAVPIPAVSNDFSEEVLLPRLVRLLDSIAGAKPVFPQPERGHSRPQHLPQPSAKHGTN